MARKGRKAKGGLYANINRRKRLGISRSKKKSSISSKAYSFMKAGFKKKRKKRGKKKKTKKR